MFAKVYYMKNEDNQIIGYELVYPPEAKISNMSYIDYDAAEEAAKRYNEFISNEIKIGGYKG